MRIAEEAEAQYEMQAQMEQLVELLQALLEAQQGLRKEVTESDVDRRHPKRAKNTPPPPPIVAPADAAAKAPIFVKSEGELKA